MSCTRTLAALGAAAALFTACAPVALGDIITVGAVRDNTLYEDFQGSLSNGAGQHMFIGATAGFAYRRALLAFDVSAIPNGSTITSASLTLHMSMTIASDREASLHRVLSDWGEAGSIAPGEEGSGAPAQPGDATWRYTFFNTQSWATLGGDFDAIASAAISVGDVGYYTWTSNAALVADVQVWLDDASANFGWEIIGDEAEPFTAKRFDTRENLNPNFRPMLTIEYQPVPEPGMMLLLAAGLCGVGGRRRRRSIER